MSDRPLAPTIDINHSCHIEAIELILTNHMASISRHIMPLVINSLGADAHTHTRTHRHSWTEAILRNQERTGAQLI